MRPTLLFTFLLLNTYYGFSQQKWDRPMQLSKCSIDIRADLFTATTFIEMEFCNPNEKEIEGLYRFELKPGQVITAFQLDLNGKYRDGSIEEKWKATNAYNTIVGKRIDPALLTMEYNGHYSLRIYPVPANGCRKVTMKIQQVLNGDKDKLLYSLPLNIQDKVQNLQLRITVSGNTAPVTNAGLLAGHYFAGANDHHFLEWTAGNMQLNAPLSFSLPLLSKTSVCTKISDEGQTYFALRFQPSFPSAYTIRPKTLTVYWDASASLSKRDINKEISFLRQFISWHNISQLTIIPFNYALLDTAVFYTENGFNSRWSQYLQNINYDGSTQLGLIDLSGMRSDLFLLFTDGNNTYGKSKPNTGTAFVSCVHTSNTADLAALAQIVGSGGGKVVDLTKMSMSAAVQVSSRGENWLMEITSASGKVITEQSLPVKNMGRVMVNGTLQAADDTLYLHYGNSRQINHVEKIVIPSSSQCPSSSIERFSMLDGFDHFIRNNTWSTVIDFGLQEKVVTPNTAYLVLERVEDYVRFNIAPPKELEEACEKMNYVKRDTRFERQRLDRKSEYDLLNNVVALYNQRLKKWDAHEKPLYLPEQELKESVVASRDESTAIATLPNETGNLIMGKAAGLQIQNSNLEEVVVTGFATSQKRNLTYSVTSVRPNDIFSSATSIEQALQGRVPGLQMSTSPGSTSTITIRGMSSVRAAGQPLFILDGVPVSGNVNDIVNMNDIDNIQVMKDPHAAAIYGSRAANGAIIINTKKGKNQYNYYNNRPYRLKDMEDVEYLQVLKAAGLKEKMGIYESLKKEYGGGTGFYFDAAQHLFETGLKEEARAVLMNAAEASNGSRQVLEAMAYIFESWQQYEEAVSIYRELIKDNPNALNLYSGLAWTYYRLGQYQEAVNALYSAIRVNTLEMENSNVHVKAMLLSDMNSIITLHWDQVNTSTVPASLVRPMPVDLRFVIESNAGNTGHVSIEEPGGSTCNPSSPVSKQGGVMQSGTYWYYTNPVDYQIRNAPRGKYKISVNYYDYSYPGKIPVIMRIRKFKNFGRDNQSIEVENVMMDNQNGDVEIAEVKW